MSDLPARPANPNWASDTNFSTAGAPYDGTPNKAAPSVGTIAEGVRPGKRHPARYENWWRKRTRDIIQWLYDRYDGGFPHAFMAGDFADMLARTDQAAGDVFMVTETGGGLFRFEVGGVDEVPVKYASDDTTGVWVRVDQRLILLENATSDTTAQGDGSTLGASFANLVAVGPTDLVVVAQVALKEGDIIDVDGVVQGIDFASRDYVGVRALISYNASDHGIPFTETYAMAAALSGSPLKSLSFSGQLIMPVDAAASSATIRLQAIRSASGSGNAKISGAPINIRCRVWRPWRT